jgi:hypothetical protein
MRLAIRDQFSTLALWKSLLTFRNGAWAKSLQNANDQSRHGTSKLFGSGGDAMLD